MYSAYLPTAHQLEDIVKACGEFLTEPQYRLIANKPGPYISALWSYRGFLKHFLIFHGDSFDKLMGLTVENVREFFTTADLGHYGNVESLLDTLSAQATGVFSVVAPSPTVPPLGFAEPRFGVHRHPAHRMHVSIAQHPNSVFNRSSPQLQRFTSNTHTHDNPGPSRPPF